MKVSPFIIGAGVIAVAALAVLLVAPRRSEAAPAMSDSQRLERGKYLVHQVGMCIDCHSPRDEKGAFIEARHLTGSPLPFAPTVPMPWMPASPKIAGLPAGFTKADTVHFLMTGERPNGKPAPLPPMPPYRMNRDDAESVASYLQSLGENQ
jgi:mono/diheme cytochrome c family protein